MRCQSDKVLGTESTADADNATLGMPDGTAAAVISWGVYGKPGRVVGTDRYGDQRIIMGRHDYAVPQRFACRAVRGSESQESDWNGRGGTPPPGAMRIRLTHIAGGTRRPLAGR